MGTLTHEHIKHIFRSSLINIEQIAFALHVHFSLYIELYSLPDFKDEDEKGARRCARAQMTAIDHKKNLTNDKR